MMKRFALVCVLFLAFTQLGFSQDWLWDGKKNKKTSRKDLKPFTEFKFGGMNPEDTGSGNLFGITTGHQLDSRLFWAFEVNYFKTTFRKETTVATDSGGNDTFVDVKQLELEFNTIIVPVFFKIEYRLDLGDADVEGPLYFRAGGGLGWNFIWNNENNFIEDIERRRFFNGLGWQMSAGLEVRISEYGYVFFDGFYNDADATRNGERNENGLPIWQSLDVSGYGFKVGLRIMGLGFAL